MKKLILLFFIVIVSNIVFAQPFQKYAAGLDGKYWARFNPDDTTYSGNVYIENIDSLLQFNLVDSLLWGNDTTSASIDTLSRRISSASNSLADKFPKFYTLSIACNDTIEVSGTADFNMSMIVIPTTYFTTGRRNTASFPNLFYRRYGSEGIPTVTYYLEGQ